MENNNVEVNATAAVTTEVPETTNTAAVMDNAIQKSLSIIPNAAVKPDPLGLVILGFGVIGVGATGYFTYKGIKWIINKVKSNSAKDETPVAEEVKEEAKEEKTE